MPALKEQLCSPRPELQEHGRMLSVYLHSRRERLWRPVRGIGPASRAATEGKLPANFASKRADEVQRFLTGRLTWARSTMVCTTYSAA